VPHLPTQCLRLDGTFTGAFQLPLPERGERPLASLELLASTTPRAFTITIVLQARLHTSPDLPSRSTREIFYAPNRGISIPTRATMGSPEVSRRTRMYFAIGSVAECLGREPWRGKNAD
jgi:hypothetical protein